MASLLFLDAAAGHSDPVVPVLLALVFFTFGAAVGGRLMVWMKQPAVLVELLGRTHLAGCAPDASASPLGALTMLPSAAG